ncbi:MAG: hypothetical protein PHV37_07060 [Candidatus Gastranaerophilales bacterium]|nr:hypothetical protein [Candidatus Gastranaerophilales bacterium]
MNVSSISFSGLEKKDRKDLVNVAINGAGSGIGKNYERQYILAKHAPQEVYTSWDKLSKVYANQNLVMLNLGSMGMKKGKTINDVKEKDLIAQLTHSNVLGKMPDGIKLDIKRKDDATFLEVQSKKGGTETIELTATRDDIDWSKNNTQIVVDTTGNNDTKEKLSKHLSGTVEGAVLSAPAKDDMLTIIPGVNNEKLKDIKANGNMVSAASCTTTCISPYIKLLNDKFGIESVIVDTTHSATGSQSVTDKAKEKANSKYRGLLDVMIPTTTGAAKATTKVIPELKGKMDGYATRVPTSSVSMAIVSAVLKKPITKEELQKTLEEAAKDPAYANLIKKAPTGSTSRDAQGRIESGLYIPESLTVVNGNHVGLKMYYDNEFGYTRSLAQLVSNYGGTMIDKE